jgi:maltooligosyltrehalose trehalohydrolase
MTVPRAKRSVGRRTGWGARPEEGGTRFSVWAPTAATVEAVLESGRRRGSSVPLEQSAGGAFSAKVEGVGPGDRYRYRVDGRGPFPDPASRFQPEGVHGPSEVIDPTRFWWRADGFCGPDPRRLVIYEIHVGTFTPAGTFAGAIDRLPELRELGVTAIELMPVADFPGRRNWGYDGVALFAPARCYGRPDDLRRLVDAAHRLELSVLLDVVYNHLGPDGNYLPTYSPFYLSERHHSPWGQGINFDGRHGPEVRGFFLENALHWIHEYRVDGLRLDATHAIVDESPRHFLAELAAAMRASTAGRQVLIIAEDSRNLSRIVEPESAGGWGLDAVWADDFHHQLHRRLTGEADGYYRDYSGSLADLAATIQRGWFYSGQRSAHQGGPRGTDSTGLPPGRFIYSLQNHDQVGNRARGERLHHLIDPAAYRAATVVLLASPEPPLLFMGQEWAASAPFLYFTDHHPELGRQVTAGRREEFRHFSAFAGARAREEIPDPQAESTFLASKLDWSEREEERHAAVLRLHQELLALRAGEPAMATAGREDSAAAAVGEGGLVIRRTSRDGPAILAVVRLAGAGTIDLRGLPAMAPRNRRRFETILTTEEPRFAGDPQPMVVDLAGAKVCFLRPGAVILRETGEGVPSGDRVPPKKPR